MSEDDTILDKIISSQRSTELEKFNPGEIVSNLLKHLSNKEQDVLRRRFGLNGGEKETLEKIGKIYKVTRERIRQIENVAIKKIKGLKNFQDIVKPLEKVVINMLEQHGNIMTERELINNIFKDSSSDQDGNRPSVIFAISELMSDKFQQIGPSKEYRKAWKLKSASENFLASVIGGLLKIIKEEGKPLVGDKIYELFSKTDFFERNKSRLSEDVILSYLDLSQEIEINPFSEYGLVGWGTIVPKRMNDKIYLILKKYKKPMHFTEIAEKINKIRFDKRTAYPPTVHNELILNDRYVLVGRGIYALKEWGYKPGVVADVLESILKESNRQMSRKELVKEVLKRRVVKKNTIHLALTDKNRFKKVNTDEYTLNEPSS